jgi:hypothetical protein
VGSSASNAGFAGLMTPTGLMLLVFFFLLLIAIISFGAAWFKTGEAKAREERQRVKEMMAEQKRNAQP